MRTRWRALAGDEHGLALARHGQIPGWNGELNPQGRQIGDGEDLGIGGH